MDCAAGAPRCGPNDDGGGLKEEIAVHDETNGGGYDDPRNGTLDIHEDDFEAFVYAVEEIGKKGIMQDEHAMQLETLVQEMEVAAKQLASVGGRPGLLQQPRHWQRQEAHLFTLNAILVNQAVRHQSQSSVLALAYLDPLTLLYRKTFYGKLLHDVAGRSLRMCVASGGLEHLDVVRRGWSRAHVDFAILVAAQVIRSEANQWNQDHVRMKNEGRRRCLPFHFGRDEFVFAFVFPTSEDTAAASEKAAREFLAKVQRIVKERLLATFDFSKAGEKARDSTTDPGPGMSIGASTTEDCERVYYGEHHNSDDDPVSRLHQLYARAEASRARRKGPGDDIVMVGLEETDEKIVRNHVSMLAGGSRRQQEEAAGALWSLSTTTDESRAMILHAGALKPLLAVLEKGTDVAKQNAAGVIMNATPNETYSVQVVRAGAVVPLVKLLEKGTYIARENAAAALGNLAVNEKCEEKIVDAGAFKPLVKILETGGEMEKAYAAGAILNLSITEKHKVKAVQAGAVAPLVALLSEGSDAAKENAAGALRNLAVKEHTASIVEAGALKPLVDLVEHGTEAAKQRAIETMTNLSYQDENKVKIVSAGALPALVAVLQIGKEELIGQAVTLLWSLSTNDDNKVKIVDAGSLRPLVHVLRFTSNSMSTQERIAGLLWNLGFKESNQVLIVEAKAVKPLVRLLRSGSDTAKENAAAALSNLVINPEHREAILEDGAQQALEKLQQWGTDQAKEFAKGALELLLQVDVT